MYNCMPKSLSIKTLPKFNENGKQQKKRKTFWLSNQKESNVHLLSYTLLQNSEKIKYYRLN